MTRCLLREGRDFRSVKLVAMEGHLQCDGLVVDVVMYRLARVFRQGLFGLHGLHVQIVNSEQIRQTDIDGHILRDAGF